MKNAVFLKINSESDLNIKSWQYWCKINNIDLFLYKEKSKIESEIKKFNKIGLIGHNVFIKWDAPNFFDTFNDEVCGVVDTSDFKKILYNIEKSNKDLNVDYYLHTDVLFLNTEYSDVIKDTLTDEQTSINYNISLLNKLPKLLYPCWNLYSIHIKDMFKYNWQLNRDTIPSFIKYAYIWNLNDLPIQYKDQVINDVWNYIKNNYNL